MTELQAKEEQTIETVCAHVACGGSLTDLCKTWDVPYHQVIRWIHTNKKLNDQYNLAIAARSEWAIESILNVMNKIINADITKLYNDHGGLKPISDWPQEAAYFVKSIETKEIFEHNNGERVYVGDLKKVTMNNKEKMIELAGKHLAMFAERVDLTSGGMSLEQIIAQARKKSDESK